MNDAQKYQKYFDWFARWHPEVIEETVGTLQGKRQWGWWTVFTSDVHYNWHLSLIHFMGDSLFYPVAIPPYVDVTEMPNHIESVRPVRASLRDIVIEMAWLGHKPCRAIMRRKWKRVAEEMEKRGVIPPPHAKNNIWRVCYHLCSDKVIVVGDSVGFEAGYGATWHYITVNERDLSLFSVFDDIARVYSAKEALEAVARNDEEKTLLLMHLLARGEG